ncbi:MAG: hypothetical protein AAGJ83_07640 [Planctomycetota bacterium]
MQKRLLGYAALLAASLTPLPAMAQFSNWQITFGRSGAGASFQAGRFLASPALPFVRDLERLGVAVHPGTQHSGLRNPSFAHPGFLNPGPERIETLRPETVRPEPPRQSLGHGPHRCDLQRMDRLADQLELAARHLHEDVL